MLLSKDNIQQAIQNVAPTSMPLGDDIIMDLQCIKDNCIKFDPETSRLVDATNAIRALGFLGKAKMLWSPDQAATNEGIVVNIVLY
jgi:hypothetical protein